VQFEKIKLKCYSDECKDVVPIKDYESHVNDKCKFRAVRCSHQDCKKEFLLPEWAKHVKEQCMLREVDCKHCTKPLPFKDLTNHLENECKRRKISCNMCKKKIVFEDQENHFCVREMAYLLQRFEAKFSEQQDMIVKLQSLAKKQDKALEEINHKFYDLNTKFIQISP